jgi:hypothetical protein
VGSRSYRTQPHTKLSCLVAGLSTCINPTACPKLSAVHILLKRSNVKQFNHLACAGPPSLLNLIYAPLPPLAPNSHLIRPQPASPRILPDKTLRSQHPESRTSRNRCSYLRIFSMTNAQQRRISGAGSRDNDFLPQANSSPKSEQRARVAQDSIDIVAELSSVSNETCSHHSSGRENGSVANQSVEKAQLLGHVDLRPP